MHRMLVICCACAALTGCALQKAPDLNSSPWTQMTVEFQAFDGTNLTRHTWSSSDTTLLDQLSRALVVNDGGDLWGIGTMTSNKILLIRADGKQFALYVNGPTRLCLNEYPNPPTGFGLSVERTFHDRLKEAIEAQTGLSVRF